MTGKPAEIQGRSLELLPDTLALSCARLHELGLRGLHCGSGLNLQRQWLNTDMIRLIDQSGHATLPGRLACIDHTAYYLEHDHTKPVPVDDGAFDWVYSEHFIEHISFQDAVQWLKEMRRLLKVGGLLRLSTPDLHRYAGGYLNGSDGFFDLHRRRLQDMGMKDVPSRPAWMMNQIFRFWGHQWIYDFDELRLALAAAGFAKEAVLQCSFRQGQVPEVCALDLPIRSDESLYVEVRRSQ